MIKQVETKRRLRPPIRIEKEDLSKLLLAIIFLILVVFPIVRMLAFIDGDSIRQVLTHSSFHEALANSLLSSLLATLITLVIAYLLAVCIQRTAIKHKALFSTLLALPMLIPSISHGMGLIILLGNNGLLRNLLHLDSSIYGLSGVVIGAVMYAFPVAFLMFSDVLKYEDAMPYEAADILGIPKHRQFLSITLPFLRKPLISIAFAAFTMIITDYGIPLMVGGSFKTIPVIMYQEVIGQLDFAKGSVYGVVLLIPAVLSFVIDLLNKNRSTASFESKPFTPATGKVQLALAYIYCVLTALIAFLPIIAFCCLAFAKKYPMDLTFTLDNVIKAIGRGADGYLINSVIIAFFVSLIGMSISFVTAYMTARVQSKLSRFLHLVSMMSGAVPGIVLGLAYVIMFRGSFVYGTIAILVMVNIIHFIASPYIMMYNSLNKINENLEAVGETLGIGRLRMIKDVFLPQVKHTLGEMFSYFFVNSMMTISAVSFLATTQNKPLALMINQFEAQMQLECAAVVSLMILCVNLLVKGLLHLMKKLGRAKSA